MTDTYTFVPGSLTVTKTIAGPSAGEQGPVTIHVDCGADVLITDITIPAGSNISRPSDVQRHPFRHRVHRHRNGGPDPPAQLR